MKVFWDFAVAMALAYTFVKAGAYEWPPESGWDYIFLATSTIFGIAVTVDYLVLRLRRTFKDE